jgi:hypothetical protein
MPSILFVPNSEALDLTHNLRALEIRIMLTIVARMTHTFGPLRKWTRQALGDGISVTPCRACAALPALSRMASPFVASETP